MLTANQEDPFSIRLYGVLLRCWSHSAGLLLLGSLVSCIASVDIIKVLFKKRGGNPGLEWLLVSYTRTAKSVSALFDRKGNIQQMRTRYNRYIAMRL